MQWITLIMYTYWIKSVLSNLHFVKDFLNMDQGRGSIHKEKNLSTEIHILVSKKHAPHFNRTLEQVPGNLLKYFLFRYSRLSRKHTCQQSAWINNYKCCQSLDNWLRSWCMDSRCLVLDPDLSKLVWMGSKRESWINSYYFKWLRTCQTWLWKLSWHRNC